MLSVSQKRKLYFFKPKIVINFKTEFFKEKKNLKNTTIKKRMNNKGIHQSRKKKSKTLKIRCAMRNEGPRLGDIRADSGCVFGRFLLGLRGWFGRRFCDATSIGLPLPVETLHVARCCFHLPLSLSPRYRNSKFEFWFNLLSKKNQ